MANPIHNESLAHPQRPREPSDAVIVHCSDCGTSEVIRDPVRGEVICTGCGLVLDSHMVDHGPEWRAFTSEERDARARTGAPIDYTRHDKGLSTTIDWRDRDANGRKLAPGLRAQIYRLRKWQIRTRVHSSIDRNLARAMSELDRITSQLSVPRPVKEASAILYRRTVERHLIRGRSIEAMIAACVYAGCRLRQVPRTLDEIAHHSRINRKELGRCYRLLLRKLDMRVPISQPTDFVPRFAQALDLSSRVQRRAIEILDKAKAQGITAGKDPTGLAAATLYIASIQEGERRTQREIAAVARVTEVTVRNRYKEMVRVLNLQVEI
ncbi:MAG: transcription initiation factor IIB [Promethearchaeota archaeon]